MRGKIKLGIKDSEHYSKIMAISILITISCFLTYYFQIVLNTNILFTHFFYIPTILSCIWWKKKGLIVPIFFAGLLNLLSITIKSGSVNFFILDNLIRGTSLICIGIIVAILSEKVSKTKELRIANERMEFFSNLLTHDMNNILQNIKSSTELYGILRNSVKDIKKFDEIIEIIKRQHIRGEKLVSNVRKLSLLENGEISKCKTDAIKVLNDAINSTSNASIDRTIDIKIDSKNITSLVEANELLIDVFENILLNAIKYNESHSIKILIKITSTYDYGKELLKFEFLDNGIGISDEKKKIIFKKGYLKDKNTKGMGFGLTLVKKIIDSYNGKIWVEDNTLDGRPNGSNFVLLIPKTN